MLNMKDVETVKFSENARFKFNCHKGMKCFTKCCSNIEIMLTPYDIVRLKNRLKLSSGEFLNDYTYIEIEEKSSHPYVFLKMENTKERKCPFVIEMGCKIYQDRPANCRYYPVGQASLKKFDDKIQSAIIEEFWFFIKESHCIGFKEDKEWTIKDWRQDQGIDIYDKMNSSWKEILLRRNLPNCTLDDKKQKAFYMACYDIDRFKNFVFESGFLNAFNINFKQVKKMKNDELELMKFGFDYTKYILGIEETFKKIGLG